MTEAEAMAIEALTGLSDQIVNYAGLWVSATFAFLTLAYFVGSRLSRFQCGVLSVFYGAFAALAASSCVAYIDLFYRLRARVETVFDESPWTPKSGFDVYGHGTAFYMFGGILLALYFLHNVRQTDQAVNRG